MKSKLTGYGWGVLISIFLLLSTGCANRRSDLCSPGTQVELNRKNYVVVKSNAIGASSGFSFLGVIPIIPPRYTKAMSNLYSRSGLSVGQAQALINVVQEKSTVYLILFSIPKLTVRADVIEFVE
jgi:hypothetical protein